MSTRQRPLPAGLELRPALPADGPAIAAMNCAMALETEGLSLDRARLEAGVAAVLQDPHKGRYWVVAGALAPGQPRAIQACLLLTYEWSDWRNGWFWWIQSVYTLPAARGLGLYGALYAEVLRLAQADASVRGLRLYVESENHNAQAVYEHLGMQPTHYRLYEIAF